MTNIVCLINIRVLGEYSHTNLFKKNNIHQALLIKQLKSNKMFDTTDQKSH